MRDWVDIIGHSVVVGLAVAALGLALSGLVSWGFAKPPPACHEEVLVRPVVAGMPDFEFECPSGTEAREIAPAGPGQFTVWCHCSK